MDALAVGSIATALKQAREHKGIALEHAAEVLRIPQRYLQALEGEGDRRLLADRMYLIPFLRTYATYLGFHADGAIRQFISELQARDTSRAVYAPESPLSPARFSAWVRPLVLLLGVFIGGSFLVQFGSAGSWWPFWQQEGESRIASRLITQPAQSPPEAPPTAISSAVSSAVSEEEADADEEARAPTPPASGASSPGASAAEQEAVEPALPSALPTIARTSALLPASPIPQVPSGLHQLQVEAVERTWLRVVVDGQQSQDMILSPNQKAEWEARDNFTLTVGNAGGIAVTFDGTPLPPLGQSGEVVRRVRLPAVEE